MSAIEKLIEAAEACLEYKSGWSTAMAAALAPARAEIARLRAELAAERSVVMQLAGPKPVDPSRKAIVDAVEEWVNRARGGDATVDEIATALLEAATRAGWMVEPSAELAAARAPMVVTTEAVETACRTWFETDDDFDDENRMGMASVLAAALPHLRPAAMPTEEAMAAVIYEHSFDARKAARAILALLRDGGKG